MTSSYTVKEYVCSHFNTRMGTVLSNLYTPSFSAREVCSVKVHNDTRCRHGAHPSSEDLSKLVMMELTLAVISPCLQGHSGI